MLRGRATCALAVLVITFASADAFGEESVETLQKQQQDELAALSTQDCVIACKALASIRRAADRICALESGPRCIDARAKADDAQRRVQAACPDCQLAANKPKDEERRAAETGQGAGEKPMAKNAPPSADRGSRGCGSCSTPGTTDPGDLGLFAFAAFALAGRLRARSRRVR